MKNRVIDIGNSCFKSSILRWMGLLEEGVCTDLDQGIAAYSVNFPEISINLGSGDAESFDSLAKHHIFVVPNLVLLGLNCILNHHVA